jgi:glycosyltransferase involved in cell wall biosynthesis
MKQPLRVLMTTTPIGGVWTYSLELGGALARQGVRVILASMGTPLRSSQRRAALQIPNVELAESAYKLEWMDDPWPAIDIAGDWLRTLVQRYAANVVHCNSLALAAVSFGVPVLCVAHSSMVPWTRAVRAREPGPEWDEYRARAACGLRAAAEVVGPTRASLQAILDAHSVQRTGRVIPHGRSPEAYLPGIKEPFIFTAGRLWDEAMALDVLDACARSVTWPIRVAGPRSIFGRPMRRASHLQLLGELEPEQVAAQMSRAGLYVLLTRYEPFGQSALEAALAGCALVLADLDSLREVWGDCAVYVSPSDPAALRRQLEALIDDSPARESLAERARARALELTSSRMASAYHAVYHELLTAHREPHSPPGNRKPLASSFAL